jgi:hypothetical protein
MNRLVNNREILISVGLFIVLSYCAYRAGYASMNEQDKLIGLPVATFTVLATHNDGKDVAVRREPDGKLGFLEGTCFSSCPRFSPGDRVDMERWHASWGTPYFVYHWQDKDDSTSYFEHDTDSDDKL